MSSFFNTRLTKWGLVLLFFIFVAIVCRYAKKNAYYDLDILFYTACVLEKDGVSGTQLHNATYAIALQQLGHSKFSEYTSGKNKYRSSIYKNPANFLAQLHFYRVKPVYVFLLSFFHRFQFSPFLFSTYLNLLAYALLSILMLYTLTKTLSFYRGYLVSLCLLLLPFITSTLRSNTPDMIGVLFLCAGVFCLLSEVPAFKWFSIPVFMLLIGTRPESVLFILILSVTFLLLRLANYKLSFILPFSIFNMFAFITVQYSFHMVPWSILYKHTVLGYIPEIQNAVAQLSFHEYLMGLRYIPNSMLYSDFFMLPLLLIYTLLLSRNSNKLLYGLALSLLINLPLRVLLLPDLTNRFYSGQLLLSFVLFFLALDQQRMQNSLVQKQDG